MSPLTPLRSLRFIGATCCKKVSGPTVINVVAVGVTLVFVSVLVLCPNGAPLRPSVCNSTACSNYSRILQKSMNLSVDPCRSFTRYVCDGWDDPVYSVRESIYVAMLNRLAQDVRGADMPSTSHAVIQRATAFYNSCDAILRGDQDELADVKDLLSRAGVSWPRRDEQPDVLGLLITTSLVLGWDSVLYVGARRGGRVIVLTAGRAFWIVTSMYELLGSYSQKQRHFEFLRDKFTRINGSEVSFSETIRASEVMTDVLANTETAGIVRLPIARSWLNDVELNMSVARAAEAFDARYFNVDNRSTVIASGSTFVRAFFGLLRRHGERAVHTYVSWCTVQIAALFANSDLILNHYGSKEKAILRHGMFCLGRVYNLLGDALFFLFTRTAVSPKSRADIKALLLTVRHANQRRIESWGFYDAERTVISNWTSLDTALVGVISEKHVTGTQDETIPDMTDSFVRNWLVIHGRAQRHLLGRTVIDSMRMHATKRQDFVLLPIAFTFPVFDEQLPASVNYAGLGAHAAEAAGELALETYSDSEAIFYAITCLGKSPFTHQANVGSVLNEILSIKVLLSALQSSSLQTAASLVNFENYSTVQLLLIAWCFLRCESKSKLFRPVCDAPLQHISDFARQFRCKRGSTLNPHNKCRALNEL
ncbi:hypothetical protein HPB50_022800 [Hyalomma asiaticum]|uniref:Uncharacterized protein n=1 Tax=Hyalomma asiaticum TaxID=266040 RepID=A0ACB7SB83_HYAAI|nr:hypothetical protein HPB50_022800 [Hyalomma asiaticum]